MPLSKDQMQCAYAAANARMEDLGIPVTPLNAAEMHDEINTQILARALRAVRDGRPSDELLFADADELRGLLVAQGTLDALTLVFVALMKETDPDPAELSDQQTTELWALVKKKDARRLSAFSSSTLAAFIIGTAAPSES